MEAAVDGVQSEKVWFRSGDTRCAAWHYPGTNGAILIMGAGLAVTKEPGTDPFAAGFAREGFSVLAFDYRRLGESGGEPRQVVRVREQLEDWDAAIAFARELPEVDPARIAIWGFSASGGHVLRVAARHPELGAAISHGGLIDAADAGRNAIRQSSPKASLGLIFCTLRDGLGALFGREPVLVPLSGPRGSVVSLGTPDAENGPRALNPGNKYPEWQQEIAARSALTIGLYRPIRDVERIAAPLLVLAYDDDGVAPPGPAIRAAQLAPRGELVTFEGGHYQAFLDEAARQAATDAMLSFLRRHLLADVDPGAESDVAERRVAPLP